MAQPKRETSKPALDTGEATFERLTAHQFVNINNIAYTSDDAEVFDIYFACSAARAPDPLRLTVEKDKFYAKSYFNDEKRFGEHFLKINKYCINVQHIAYIESSEDQVVITFNARIADSFVQVALFGQDAETFRKKARAF
jgi:hypothetical protein